MNEGLIPRRYAKALFKVDTERSSAKRTFVLMNNIICAFESEPRLSRAMANPFVEINDKIKMLSTAASATDADTTFADFLKLLAKNRRIDLIHSIARSYADIYRSENNIRRVEVVSAAPFEPSVEERIKQVIEKHLNGASMDFSTRVDADLIGGFIVNIDNERLDASVSNSFKQLRLSLLN